MNTPQSNYIQSITRNVTTTDEDHHGVTIRRHVDHDEGDRFSAELFNASGWRVGRYKTEAGVMRAADRLVANGGH